MIYLRYHAGRRVALAKRITQRVKDSKLLERTLYLVGAACMVAYILIVISRTEFVVMHGVKETASILIALFAAGLACLGAGLFFTLRRRLQLRRTSEAARIQREQAPRKEDLLRTGEVKTYLLEKAEGKPLLAEYVRQFVRQMEQMDEKQAKLADIIRVSGEGALSVAAGSVESAEVSIFGNVYKAANRAAIWDPVDAKDPEKADVYDANRKYIERLISANAEILTKTDVLLTQALDYIDGKDRNTGGGTVDIEAATEALKRLTQEA
jgi:hypothetical protein